MPWKCHDCGQQDGAKIQNRYSSHIDTISIEVSCHHCGKLLCQQDRHLIVDEDFSQNGQQVQVYHCEECHQKYHPKAQRINEFPGI